MWELIASHSYLSCSSDPLPHRSCLFVTTRILVVDLLSGRLSGRAVSGCIVLNAHRVTETSGEGFAVRLFRAANRNGFVRAFSDQPVSFLGFSKVSLPHKDVPLSR